MSAGMVVLVATPIGNLGDLSSRAIEVLGRADRWIVEDSRVSGKLQAHLGLKKPMRVLNEHTRDAAIATLLREARDGVTALLTDGGTPAISDPGARFVDLAVEAGLQIDAIPGPSAVTTALMLSGFYAQRFAFLGFLARKPGGIKAEFALFADSPYTLVVFESPFRVHATLSLAYEALGDRRFAACREMTKLHQEVIRGRLSSLQNREAFVSKGEYCLVIEGKRRAQSAENGDVLE
jgi:16S rRNA (cytidine1402-2'-O)-methyltransferase